MKKLRHRKPKDLLKPVLQVVVSEGIGLESMLFALLNLYLYPQCHPGSLWVGVLRIPRSPPVYC